MSYFLAEGDHHSPRRPLENAGAAALQTASLCVRAGKNRKTAIVGVTPHVRYRILIELPTNEDAGQSGEGLPELTAVYSRAPLQL